MSDALASENIANRVIRLCHRAIESMALDLSGITVLTEAATGPFAITPVVAALAGAEVRAIGRDSRWGSATEAFRQVHELATKAGAARRIAFQEGSPEAAAHGCHLVTNLGPIRPINEELIEKLAPGACVSLMWEPWEFRPEEINLTSLAKHNVALIATNEHHPEIQTFKYLGPTIARLMLSIGIEIVRSRLLIIGSDPFGNETAGFLERAGASILREWDTSDLDAIIYVEHRDHDFVLGTERMDSIRRWGENGAPVIRLCGRTDDRTLSNAGVSVFPCGSSPPGVMSVTTAFAGPRPVVDLHAGGMRAASDVIRARQRDNSIHEAIEIAVRNGFALAVNPQDGVDKQ